MAFEGRQWTSSFEIKGAACSYLCEHQQKARSVSFYQNDRAQPSVSIDRTVFMLGTYRMGSRM